MNKQHSRTQYLRLTMLLLIAVHAWVMNGFYFIHPYNNIGTYYVALMSKIDPTYFAQSIFTQAINRNNLRLSIFYDILPFFLKNVDFETFAMIQGGLSLFFILAGIYALTYQFFKNSYAGFIAASLYSVQLNEWTLGSPAAYLNFFHHGLPYAYPLAVWSLVFFFQSRYVLSLCLAGISWNFHPMSTVFLLIPYAFYFIFNIKNFPLRTVFPSLVAFSISACPGLIKASIHASSTHGATPLWFKGVQWNAWYTCLPSTWPILWIVRAGLFFILSIMCISSISDTALKRKIYIFFFAVACMCLIGTIFAGWYPLPIILKFSFWRSTFIYLVLALPCIAQTFSMLLHQGSAKKFFSIIFIILLTGYCQHVGVYYFPFFLIALCYALWEHKRASASNAPSGKFLSLVCLMLLIPMGFQIFTNKLYPQLIVLCIAVSLFSIAATFLKNKGSVYYKPLLLSIAFVVLFDLGVLYEKGGAPVYYHGKINGVSDPWADIQMQARLNSNRDDLFIVPPYLNDFGNYSLRATLSDWAEGANILYLDNQFAEQWFERMQSLGWTEFSNAKQGYNQLTTEDIMKAAHKYGAKFAITEKPKRFNLPCVYENEHYILYKIS